MRFLYLRYADNVYGYVCSIVRDEHEAEDVTQQIFAKLMTALAALRAALRPFSAWILRIAHNAAIDSHARPPRRAVRGGPLARARGLLRRPRARPATCRPRSPSCPRSSAR